MNLLLSSPAILILLKWSGLLAVGWAAQALLWHRHARWRVLLWRSLLCAGLLLPLTAWVAVPGIKIPVAPESVSESADLPPSFEADPVPLTGPATTATSVAPTKTFAPSIQNPSAVTTPIATPISKARLLLVVWAVGAVVGMLRLLRWHWQLSRLCRAAEPASPDVLQTAVQIQRRLRVKTRLDVRVSRAAASPFACGLFKPVIILPQILVQELSSAEISTLLSHEIAHFRRRDLVWCVAWRWVQALCWFHPLVWGIPAAHSLACEQEADRLASSQLADRNSYVQLLAQLALRILALPGVETGLTVNGSSEIAQRLRHLARIRQWDWRWAAAGLALATVIFGVTAGCQITPPKNGAGVQTTLAQAPAGPAGVSPAQISFSKVLVVVRDENGQPVAGATVKPTGFRVKGMHGADAYPWNQKLFGPAEKTVTDGQGRAWVKYPIESIPEEKEYTGALILMVSHPDFASLHIQTYLVDGSESPVQIHRGLLLRVSAWYGSGHEPVPEVVFKLNQEDIQAEDWQKQPDGTWTFHEFSPGEHIIQAMGRLPSGQVLFSDARAFSASTNGEILDLEMKPGIRVEGRLDDQVPRPVTNGRVLIDVRPPQIPAFDNYSDVENIFKEYPDVRYWKTYRSIAPDGTFVFESVPPGGLDVVAVGDGFVSSSGGVFGNKNNGQIKPIKGFCLPQAFALTAPVTQVVVATEPSATLEVRAKNREGRPMPNIKIVLSPNVVRMGGTFGAMSRSDESPCNGLPGLSNLYVSKTDADGNARFANVPAYASDLGVMDQDYQVPLQDLRGWRNRIVRFTLSPGQTNHLDLTLVPVGTDFVGGREVDK
jgi:beta-lactamase regulating signal transducer with metallopeptidase domain